MQVQIDWLVFKPCLHAHTRVRRGCRAQPGSARVLSARWAQSIHRARRSSVGPGDLQVTSTARGAAQRGALWADQICWQSEKCVSAGWLPLHGQVLLFQALLPPNTLLLRFCSTCKGSDTQTAGDKVLWRCVPVGWNSRVSRKALLCVPESCVISNTLLSFGVCSEQTFLQVIKTWSNTAVAPETRKPGNRTQRHCVGLQKHHLIC